MSKYSREEKERIMVRVRTLIDKGRSHLGIALSVDVPEATLRGWYRTMLSKEYREKLRKNGRTNQRKRIALF